MWTREWDGGRTNLAHDLVDVAAEVPDVDALALECVRERDGRGDAHLLVHGRVADLSECGSGADGVAVRAVEVDRELGGREDEMADPLATRGDVGALETLAYSALIWPTTNLRSPDAGRPR